ncbi:Vi polysaccharide biosynthesis UDP-N-acetylglucosamine C-6 dehydrogenase TviB [Enterovibrio sp. 27052020O]|uniref:Vi polysaccharide biosynthesis UDP-N-acetylglucosamine C-6 dehydrogenase TviB n=1 Tax=Enterovibrio sp. 27052020O TaxID=3241166 RepID=UPI00388E5E3F
MEMNMDNVTLGIIGMGYVGLPLAVEFGKHVQTLGYDIDKTRIEELSKGVDRTLECSSEELASVNSLFFTDNLDLLKECSVYIVTVPTPIDEHKQPDLTPLIKASNSIGKILKSGDIVIYESTVYPGATEEVCIPVLEQISGLKYNIDFFAGYSPERINPGDKLHRVTNILKVTSGSTPEVACFVDELYRMIIEAGTHKASSIKVAEAAKIIENTQRDVNIALINELSIIFNRLDIDTLEVLEAAGTKWNFLPFRPGLVGGHCIGVDPYYLTHKAQSVGYHPDMILAGRKINDGMGAYTVSQLVKKMIKKKIQVENSNVLIMGLTFKENCPDLRNTKVIDVIRELEEYNINIDVYDPWCAKNEAYKEYGLSLCDEPKPESYDAVIITVAHDEFREMGIDMIRSLCKKSHVIYDLKYLLNKNEVDIRL